MELSLFELGATRTQARLESVFVLTEIVRLIDLGTYSGSEIKRFIEKELPRIKGMLKRANGL